MVYKTIFSLSIHTLILSHNKTHKFMIDIYSTLSLLCLIPIICGSVFSIITVFTTKYFLKSSRTNTFINKDFTPPVSVLKPVRGLEKNLESNLRSITKQKYPNYQIIYSVQASDDPAYPILKKIQSELGRDFVSVVISTVEEGANGKVNNLLGAIDEAKHELFIISDSDTYLQSDYISNIVTPLTKKEVGCVCTPFKLIKANSLCERLEMLTINSDFIPSVIFAYVTGASNSCLGPSIAIHKSTLDSFGGLKSLANYLVEDYEIGRRVWTSGKSMILLPYVIDVVVDLKSWKNWWDHQVYWDQNTYLARPGAFISTIFIRAIPFAIIFCMLEGSIISLWVLIITIFIRIFTAFIVAREIRDNESIKNLYLLPLRDMFGLIFWGLAFTQRTVIWRNSKYKLTKHGKMTKCS